VIRRSATVLNVTTEEIILDENGNPINLPQNTDIEAVPQQDPTQQRNETKRNKPNEKEVTLDEL